MSDKYFSGDCKSQSRELFIIQVFNNDKMLFSSEDFLFIDHFFHNISLNLMPDIS